MSHAYSPVNPMITKTLAPENQLLINCPVFSVDVKIAGCFLLRDMVWRGERPTQRRGCQVAMQADKCPINRVIMHMLRTGEDKLHSTEPKMGQLPEGILMSIAPVLVMENAIAKSECSPGERQRLLECNERAGTSAKAALDAKPKRAPKKVAAPLAPIDETITAAVSGDMGAAVTAAVADVTGAEE